MLVSEPVAVRKLPCTVRFWGRGGQGLSCAAAAGYLLLGDILGVELGLRRFFLDGTVVGVALRYRIRVYKVE